MPADLLGLFVAHGLTPKQKTAREWESPCPACGGTDRCMIKPEDHEGRGGYWCRRCGIYGDAIQFMRDFGGLSYTDACRALGVEAAKGQVASSLPKLAKPKAQAEPFAAAPTSAPNELWTTKAAAFADWCHGCLLAHTEQLAWLAKRGLSHEAVVRYRLGWNPGEKGKSCLIRHRKGWGLPDLPATEGKKAKTTFWLPRGLVIPQLSASGAVTRLRIRRPEPDRQVFNPDTKYYVVPGSAMDALMLADAGCKVFTVVESELDALMLHHVAADLVGVVSVMTASVRNMAAPVLAALNQAACILVALDFDTAGANGFPRWQVSFPQAKRWPCPVGKDPGEAAELGFNLRTWIIAGLPPVFHLGVLPPAPAAAAPAPEASADSPPAEALAEDPSIPAAATGDDASLSELRQLLQKHKAAPVLIPRPEPFEYCLALCAPEAATQSADWSRIQRLTFRRCLDELLFVLRINRLRQAEWGPDIYGLSEPDWEWGVIVRDAGAGRLEFVGWTNVGIKTGRCPEKYEVNA